VADGEVELLLGQGWQLEVLDQVGGHDERLHGSQGGGRAHEAALEQRRVELGDADADAVALHRREAGLLELLHAFHPPHHAQLCNFHVVADFNAAPQHRA
jgi:hypothetical protein